MTTFASADELAAVDDVVVVPAPRSRYRNLVLAALIVGACLRLLAAQSDVNVGPDEAAYIGTGESIWDGQGITYNGSPQVHFPPMLPFIFGGLARVLPEPHDATVLVTFLASTAVVVVGAAIGRRAGGDSAGIAAAWFLALTPGVTVNLARGTGGSEAPYVFLVLASVAAALRAGSRVGRPRLAWATGAGALLAGAYLTRPEALMLVIVVAPLVVVPALGGWPALRPRRGVSRRWRAAALAGVVFLAPVAAAVMPYMSFLHTHTGSWQLSAKTQDVSIAAWLALADGGDRVERDRHLYHLGADGLHVDAPKFSLIHLARDDPGGYLDIIKANLNQLRRAFFTLTEAPVPGWRLFPVPLLALSFLGAWRRRTEPAVLAVLGVLGFALLTTLVFFVLLRYLGPAAAALAILAGVGVSTLRAASSRWVLPIALVVCALSAFANLEVPGGRGVPEERRDTEVVGEWLAANTPPDTTIATRSKGIPYYAHRRLVAPPWGTAMEMHRYLRFHGVDLLVLDPTLQYFRPQFNYLLDTDDAPGFRLVKEFGVDGRPSRVFALEPIDG